MGAETNGAAEGSAVVLSVENEAVIAFGIADDLVEAGFVVAGPYRSSVEALGFLEKERPDLAIIEYKLNDQIAFDLAQKLKDQGVPFVVFSSWRRGPDIPPAFESALWIEKPASRDTIVSALESLRTTRLLKSP